MLAGVWVLVQIVVAGARKALTGRGVLWSMVVASLGGMLAMLGLIQLIGLMGRFNFAQGLGWIDLRSPIIDFIFFMGSALGLMRDLGQTELPFRIINLTIVGVSLFSGAGLWRRWNDRSDRTDW